MPLRVLLSLLLLTLHLTAFDAASRAVCADTEAAPPVCCPLCEVGTEAGLACMCGCGDVTPRDGIPDAPERAPIAPKSGSDDVPAADLPDLLLGTAAGHGEPLIEATEHTKAHGGRVVLLSSGRLII